jgi:aldehyde dehydrogenase (NAD+)
MTTLSENSIKSYFNDINNHIRNNEDALYNILFAISNYRSVLREIKSAIKTLKGGWKEIQRELPPIVNHMVVFYPTNVLLYSYILYVVIPSAFCKRITIRSSHRDLGITEKIHNFFSPVLKVNCDIQVLNYHQRKFIKITQNADLVVHTGQYDNALNLKELYKDSLFLFFGSGTNPFIIGESPNFNKSVRDAIDSRINNSGQDCMCQDYHFVNNKIFNRFVQLLIKKVTKLVFGPAESKADYSNIVYEAVFDRIQSFYENNKKHCIYNGDLSLEQRKIDPMIFIFENIDLLPDMEEFFAPIFVIVRYEHDQQCNEWLLKERQLERAMGLSIYGSFALNPKVKDHYVTTYGQDFMSIENGNIPFGGYGKKTSLISYCGKNYSRPILISREASVFLKM